MKRLGILLAILALFSFALWAQDNSSSSSTTTQDNSGNTTTSTTTTTTHDDSGQATSTSPSTSDRKANDKARARSAENAADKEKDNAKNASGEAATRDKALARLDDSAKILDQLLAAKDSGIPESVFDNAKCVAVVPSMVKGGFIFGAEHGRGVATCRTPKGWSAPAFFTVTGGSWGAQIGGQAVDLVMLFMTDEGAKHLLDAKVDLGADASVAGGPVGREASANTDWKFKTGVLTYSRARGIFAGAVLKGAAVRQDDDSTTAVYGKQVTFRQILTGQVPSPSDAASKRFLATVAHQHAEAAAAH